MSQGTLNKHHTLLFREHRRSGVGGWETEGREEKRRVQVGRGERQGKGVGMRERRENVG